MYIINASDFKFPFEIPNTTEAISSSGDQLNLLIDVSARLCLQDALGFELFDSLDGDIVDGELKPDADPRWDDFVNGKEYTSRGKTMKWPGLKAKYGDNNLSVLVSYAYYNWISETYTKLNGVGQGTGKAKNVVQTNHIPKAVEAWNGFLMLYQGDYFTENPKALFDYYYFRAPYFYRGYLHNSCMNRNRSGYVSMLRYLYDNKDVYPEPRLEVHELQNSLGL